MSKYLRILLIDDDEDEYYLTKALLEDKSYLPPDVEYVDYVLDWVPSFEEAVLELEKKRHDAYLIDYYLGNRNGLELLQEALARDIKAPMIILTGQGNYELDVSAKHRGADDYLVKGQINSQLLERSIRYAIARKQAEETLKHAYDELELRVQERTFELAEANRALQAEIVERKQAQDALNQSETKFRTLAETTSTAIFIVQDMRVRYANRAASLITGYPVEELLQIELWEIAHPQYQKMLMQQLQDSSNGLIPRYEVKVLTKDGDERWVDITKGSMQYQGRPAWVVTAFDITERDLAEQALQKAKDELEGRVIQRTQELSEMNEALQAEIAERAQAEAALRRIEWLLTKSVRHESLEEPGIRYPHQPYGNLASLNKERMLLDAVGEDVLYDIVSDFLDLLDTSAVVYEKNGDTACGIYSSRWCRFLDMASREKCGEEDNAAALASGRWICQNSCWTKVSKVAIETGRTVDIECDGGLNICSVPIWAGGEVIGAINVGYGDPPKDPAKLEEIAQRYDVSSDLLLELADSYETRPPFMVDLAKNRLIVASRLLGTIVERRWAEEERERLVEQLRHRAQEFKALVENSPDIVYRFDRQLQYLYLNPVGERLFGIRYADVVGKPMNEIGMPEESFSTIYHACEVVFQTRQEAVIDLVIPTMDGLRYFEARLVPEFAYDGTVESVLAVGRDITQRQIVEQALQSARDELEMRVVERTKELETANEVLRTEIAERKRVEELIRQSVTRAETLAEVSQSLVEAGPDCDAVLIVVAREIAHSIGDACVISLLSDDGAVLKPAAYSHKDDEALNLLTDVVTDGPVSVHHGIGAEVLQTGKTIFIPNVTSEVLPSLAKAEHLAYFKRNGISSALCAPMRLQGKMIGTLTLIRDKESLPYTQEDQVFIQSLADRTALAIANARLYQDVEKALQEEQSMRRQLVQAEKHSAMSRMVASVAHELNNPIQTIQNCLFLISQDIQPASDTQEFLQMALDETRRVSRLVTQLREVYRPSKSESLRPVVIQQVLAEVRSLLEAHLQHQNVHWEQSEYSALGDITVNGIVDQLKQVMINISLNAIEAMQPEGGTLMIETLMNGAMVGIKFQDNGPGIQPDFLSRLFDPFFTTKESGTGLGLAICFDIVQRHGGEIAVESKEGQGASFTVWLPVVASTSRKALPVEAL